MTEHNIDSNRIMRYEISARQKDPIFKFSALEDFELARGLPQSAQDFYLANPSLYALDIENEQAIFVSVTDLPALVADPFLHSAQFQQATQVWVVSWHLLPVLCPQQIPQLYLVHSVGRCGSTLIANLLKAVGIVTFSEPDAFTSLEVLRRTARQGGESVPLQSLVYWCVQAQRLPAWTEHATFAIKFRSQSAPLCRVFARQFRFARHLFMVRERSSWVLSVYRNFRLPPTQLAYELQRCLYGLKMLEEEQAQYRLVRYEQIQAAKQVTIAEIFQFFGMELDFHDEKIQQVMTHHSQASSPMINTDAATFPTEQEEHAFLAQFEEDWQKIRPVEIIEQFGLQDIY